MKVALLLVGLAAFAAGCGAGETSAPAPSPAPAPVTPAPPAGDSEPDLYEATATVLEARDGEPMLCLGGVLESYPPQCGDVPLTGWSWDAVAGEESAAGVTWGDFHVAGSFDGETFAVVEVGPPRWDAGEEDDDLFLPPCPEPVGGWLAGGGAAGSQKDVGPAEGYARRQPEYARSWVYHVGDRDELEEGEYEEDLPVVYVAVFTRDAARHEAELRTRWSGPLCVAERDVPSAREGRRIRADAEASLEGLGLQMLSSWEGELGLAAEIEVVADPGSAGQAALDARLGPGLVRLVPALRPVGSTIDSIG